MRDENLEAISDKIRQGIPIDFLDAIAAINYQEQLRHEREQNSFWNRIKRYFRSLNE